MRLGLVLPARVRNQPRALNRYWLPILDALGQAGVDVCLTQPKISLVYLPGASRRRPPLLTLAGPLFLRELRHSRPDAVLTMEFGAHSLWAALAGRLWRTPVLVFHEHEGRVGSRLSAARAGYRKLLLHLARGAVANTDGARRDLEDVLGVAPERIVDVPLLVAPEREALSRVPRDLPDIGARPVFLFAGRLAPGKNVAALVAAAELLHRDGLRFALWIAGDGEERGALERLVGHSGLRDRISFLGPVDYGSVGFVLAASDVFVMPTLYDYRSVAVLEAMRFGKPVIDSAGDGNAGDVVRDGVNGIVVDPRDVGAIADAMRVFIAEPGRIAALGAAAAAAVDELTPTRAAAALRGALDELLRDRRVDLEAEGSQR
jgi:glycosyltransferase involved in cell wall biosynthesis